MNKACVRRRFELSGRNRDHLALRLNSLVFALGRRRGKVLALRWSEPSEDLLVSVIYELPIDPGPALEVVPCES